MKLAGRWRRPLSLGLGLPLLFGSTSAAAASSGSLLLGGLTTWLGVLAALWALLAPRRPGDVAGAAAVAALGGLLLASAAWGWRRQRARRSSESRWGVRGATRESAEADVDPRAPPGVPALDGAAILEAARSRFLRLQAAWDAGDVQALGHLTTPEMLGELLPMLRTRPAGRSRTDVITLHAELLGLEELGPAWLASVEFSGLIRESTERGAVPFRELWMLAAAKDGVPSWRLARQQALF